MVQTTDLLVGLDGLMVKDHCKIERLFDSFKAAINQDSDSALKEFNKFKWELEKHFFVEEKAIFIFYVPKRIEETVVMLNLIREHNLILEMLRVIEHNLFSKKEPDLSSLQGLLLKHKTFEDEVLYPKLNDELNPLQKTFIIERINRFRLY